MAGNPPHRRGRIVRFASYPASVVNISNPVFERRPDSGGLWALFRLADTVDYYDG